MNLFNTMMPSILVLLSAIAASVYHVEGVASNDVNASMVMVEVKCLEEEGKESKCIGVSSMTTPSPMFLNGVVSYAGGYSWDYQFVNALLEEGGIEIGETDYNVVRGFVTQEKIKVQITDEGQCTITVNGTETCRACESAEVGCFDGSNSQVRYDCTNLPMGKASLDECVPLNPTADVFYPFELKAEDPYFHYDYKVKDADENVYRYDSEVPACFKEPMLIRQDSSTVPMCAYDSNFLSVEEFHGSSVTVKVNDVWSTAEIGLIPFSTQVFVHTNGVDSILRNETSDNFQCSNTEGTKLDIQAGIGSQRFEVQCIQATPDDPFLAAIDLVITDDIIMGSNEVGHPCYENHEPIYSSCSYRLILPCSQDEMCFKEEVVGAFAATRSAELPSGGDDSHGGLCDGKSQVETDLDLYNAVVTNNTLHLPDGKLVYENVGTVRGKEVNLVVTVKEGEYKTTEEAALLKNGKGTDENGNWGEGMFGNINLLTVQDHADSGEASFEFCFRDNETDALVTVDSFQWTVYDLDERSFTTDECPNCIKEKFIFDTSQAENYLLSEDTEVQLFCESFTLWPDKSIDAHPSSPQMPCPPGDRTVFHSSTTGTVSDNPTDKDDMTRQQLRRSVQFTFKDTSCFHFTYNHYCPPTEVGSNTPCQWYGSGNFLFAGAAQQLIEEGECITASPTTSPSPTKNPTVSPTTSAPSEDPTIAPTVSPTKGPTVSPTVSPTKVPTVSPSASPTKNPTVSPTASPTKSPTVSPTASPTKDPTVSPTASPTKNPTVSPTAYPTKSPTVEPTKTPTVSPTVSPTKSPTAEPTKTPTVTPTASPTTTPTVSPTKGPTKAPTTLPSASPSGSFYPSSTPSDYPTKSMSPSLSPTDVPTKAPTKNPTASPTESPTFEPTKNPTAFPTKSPTVQPTMNPTASPTKAPTVQPTKNPTSSPTNAPSAAPSGSFYPSSNPTDSPSKSMAPTSSPTDVPTKPPTPGPTKNPTASPTKAPTVQPTKSPTSSPTNAPSAAPSGSFYPSSNPTDSPSKSMAPSSSPTDVPTKPPTPGPTKNPTASPTKSPTVQPTKNPTSSPTNAPSAAPSGSFYPSSNPTDSPSKSMSPTSSPTDVPTKSPTPGPTKNPTASPTASPTAATLSPTKGISEGNTKQPSPIVLPDCPEDVILLNHKGETEIDLDRVVKVVSQDRSTVTVALNQGWDPVVEDLYVNNNDYYYHSEDEPIDHIFYSYRSGHFNEVCYEEQAVKTDEEFATIEITCSVTKPYALLELCVADNLEHGFLTSEDNATVPKCCEPSFPPETPTVCYTIEIKCVSECLDDATPTRRGLLRGGASN